MATKPVTFFNFSGGINSEATPLNMPPTDLIECINAKINRNGSIERRGGADYIDTGDTSINRFQILSGFNSTDAGTTATYEMWDAPVSTKYVQLYTASGDLKKLFVLVAGVQISIFDITNPNVIRDIRSPTYSIAYKFNSYVPPEYDEKYIFEKAQIICDSSSIFIINKFAPIQRIYIDSSGLIKSEKMTFYTRDLSQNVSDDVVFIPTDPYMWDNSWTNGLIYLCRQSHTQSTNYNQIAATWTEPTNAYDMPPGYQPWEYSLSFPTLAQVELDPQYPPNNPTLWEFWDKRDRASFIGQIPSWPRPINTQYKSNIIKLTDTGRVDATGFIGGCVAMGRLWLSGRQPKGNSIYFSQVVKKNESFRYGYLYQRADPRSYSSINDTDIVETDGGEIVINDAMTITALHPYREGILAFAQNGVWYITGETGFKPNNYRIEKISDKGALNTWSIVSNDDFVFFAAYNGIYGITTTKDFRSLEAAPLTNKIQTLLNNIPISNREIGMLRFNAIEQRLYYFYNDTYDWVVYNNKNTQPCHFRQALIFDVPTQSWYQWELAEDVVGINASLVHMETLPISLLGENESVFDSTYALVEDELNRAVEVWGTITNTAQFSNICVFGRPNIGSGKYEIAFGFFETNNKQDFESEAGDTLSFDTSVKFAYQTFGDSLRNKGAPYIQMLFRRTETGEMDTDTNTDLNEGGCLGRFIFYWTNGSRGPKYGDQKQLYYSDRMTLSYPDFTDNDVYMVTHKQKLRGLGESFQVELTNDGDKPFHLYGYELLVRGFARE